MLELTPIRKSDEAECPAKTPAERRGREAPGSIHRTYGGLWEFRWTGPHTQAMWRLYCRLFFRIGANPPGE